jgi:hypothetical protein
MRRGRERLRLRSSNSVEAAGRPSEVFTFGQLGLSPCNGAQAPFDANYSVFGNEGIAMHDLDVLGGAAALSQHQQLQPLAMPSFQIDGHDMNEFLAATRASNPSSSSQGYETKEGSPPKFCITAPMVVRQGVECTKGVDWILSQPSPNDDDLVWSLESGDTNVSSQSIMSPEIGSSAITHKVSGQIPSELFPSSKQPCALLKKANSIHDKLCKYTATFS